MANSTKTFGRAIKHKDAEEMFQRLLKIKHRSFEPISKALDTDAEASRYYCGRKGAAVPEWEDLAFLFDKATLMRIIGRVLSNEADGVVVFRGAQGEKDADEGASEREVVNTTGRPTIMVFPYKKGEGGVQQLDDGFNVFTDDGDEHPGSGFKLGETTGSTGSANDPTVLPLPKRFNIEEVEKILLV